MQKATKIVATLGPASDSIETIESLILAGVNVFRFNMKHGTTEWHEERIKRVQEVSEKLRTPIGILIDLQGPEIRINTFNGEPVEVAKGETIKFSVNEAAEGVINIPGREVFEDLHEGDIILIDDGFMEFEVTAVQADGVEAKALEPYSVKTRKGVNLPGKAINLPSLVDQDLARLDMASRSKVDFVALSFCRNKSDIEILREAMAHRNVTAMVVAKIESQQALDNLDELIEAADAIMVARGDLGVEVPIEQLAFWQEQMVTKCRAAHKPVIVATQMLQSMIENPRPTRAEATDVANAVFDGTDAIMLSGETASGKFPVKAVTAMTRIASFNEGKSIITPVKFTIKNSTHMIVKAAVDILNTASEKTVTIDTVVVFTQTGYTARVLSSFRPRIKLIAVTDEQKTVEELAISFGVTVYKAEFPEGEFSLPHKMIQELVEEGLIEKGNNVLVIHGQHWKQAGLTNALELIKA